MKRCPITYAHVEEAVRYSKAGLNMLSRSLAQLHDLGYSAEEQREEAMVRATKMSIQGVQPKLSARLRVKAGCFEIVDRGGQYILKPQHHFFRHVPENEDVTMRLAKSVGIEVPVHGLVYSRDESLTYFIRRFDRIGRNAKLAVEDFAQLAGATRDTKYDFSMERLVPLIDRHCTFPAVERVELFRRILFCFLTGNEDMHLKNFSVIVKGEIVKLAPAYDFLNTTIALRQAEEEMALPLNGKKRNLTRNDLVRYYGTERLRLEEAVIDGVLGAFAVSIPEWAAVVEASFLPESLKEEYMNLVSDRASRLGV
jgi:serine/threonine-protein kinase HipA